MSIAGPNCSGSLLAITTLNWRKTQAPATLRLGLRAFAHEPFTPRRHQWRSNTAANHPHDDGDDLIRRITHHSVQRACPLCDHGRVRRTDDGPWHLFLECNHIEVAALRRRMLSSTPRMLRQLDALTTAAMERAGLFNTDEATDAVTARSALLEEILDDADWSSRDGKHLIFHLLCALPFPARIATGLAEATPLSAWLGKLFDETTLGRRFCRKTANHTILWAHKWITAFAKLRTSLLRENRNLQDIAGV